MIQSTADFLPVLPESGHLGSSILYFHPPTITKRRKARGYYRGNYFLSVFSSREKCSSTWPVKIKAAVRQAMCVVKKSMLVAPPMGGKI